QLSWGDRQRRPEAGAVPYKSRVGLVIIVLTIPPPLVTAHWLKIRKFQPVNMPVLLPVGHVETTVFETNLRGDYFVNFEVDYEISYRATRALFRGVIARRALDSISVQRRCRKEKVRMGNEQKSHSG